jgi:multidrug efflux pump subunit AcrA (membrane-fusion protein)
VKAAGLFRREAVDHQRQGGARGDVLRLTPRSLLATQWLLMVALVVGLYYAFAGQIDEHAAGPAVVFVDGLHEVTAPRAGVVASVEVAPGEQVKAGQPLVRMVSSTETAELETVERELADQLAKLLADPSDAIARESMVSLRSRRELARLGLERQVLRAPLSGTVGDVRVRTGQLVEPGMPVVSVHNPGAGARLMAMLPGRYRPLLRPGARLRFVAEGFSREVHGLVIERVGDQIIGPLDAARYLGLDQSAAAELLGPVVLVQARIPQLSFTSEGGTYRFHHGMRGSAESAVRHESIAFTFVPGLKQVFSHVL